MGGHGDIALIIDIPGGDFSQMTISAYKPLSSTTDADIQAAYLSACNSTSTGIDFSNPILMDLYDDKDKRSGSRRACYSTRSISVPRSKYDTLMKSPDRFISVSATATHSTLDETLKTKDREQVSVFAGKKYKPVAQKVRAMPAELADEFRIVRNITGEPLEEMPSLSTDPPPFSPTGRYTTERKEKIDDAHADDFLWEKERDLMHHFMMLQNEGFAWDDSERGSFREDFFPPVKMPVIEHKPWVLRNIPIPPGIYNDVCKIIKTKIDAGVYEPSNSSYRSRWFCVLKKGGKNLRLVHSLEPLNAVTVQHSGVPPHTEAIAEQFACRACTGILDLFVGYDERILDVASRDYTTFQTPFGPLRLVTLPMGWSNSVPIFHDDVTHILRPEIPHVTIPYIDDVPIRGPASRYIQDDGSFETIPENNGIRRFVWEYFQGINRVVQRMKYCGGTFSGPKAIICAKEIDVVGHRCTWEGRMPEPSRVAKIVNWGPCRDLSDVRAFLGTVGVLRHFIAGFAKRANALVKLTRKGEEFRFGEDQVAAQEDLKAAVVASPALRPLDYESGAPVILAVDTSSIAVGYILSQCSPSENNKRYFSRFGSITLNEREARFSQPKLEIYGLFRALRALKHYLIGIRNLIVEVDARYIKGMLKNPDINPSASINRWILSILTFHFELVHVPGIVHGPDGLSRRRPQPGDDPEPEDEFDDWIDNLYGFLHLINRPLAATLSILPPVSTFALEEVNHEYVEKYNAVAYGDVPRANNAREADKMLALVPGWLNTLQRPESLNDNSWSRFTRFAIQFFLLDNRLWRRGPSGDHKLVIWPESRINVLRKTHDDLAHKGYYATHALLTERFWWPSVAADVNWFIKTCILCQVRQRRLILIPPTVALPAPLFTKMYMDTMHLPPSGGFRHLVQGRCSITHYPEFRALRTESAATLGEWIFQDILCRWGTLSEIVTDNGAPFVKAMEHVGKKYHVHHIRVSGYNSRANGTVERAHWDVRQALFKAADGEQDKWHRALYSCFWADRITTRKRMGVSPYFAVTGTHPIIPLDIVEASYLIPPPDSILSSTDLIANRAIALQKRHDDLAKLHTKVYAARVRAARRFEDKHASTIRDFEFKKGDLVLSRNTAIEKSLNKKMRARYLGPLIVLSRNRGGAYLLAEMDGSVLDRPTAAFRLVPYLPRRAIPLPDLESFIDVSRRRIEDMEADDAGIPGDISDELEGRVEEVDD